MVIKFRINLLVHNSLQYISCLAALLIVVGVSHTLVAAQSVEELWSEPKNISNSGGGGQPWMVVDWSGVLHVIWEDQFDGLYYTTKTGEEWSVPVPVSLPFDRNTPILTTTRNGRIHAFWIRENELVYSRVAAGSFADGEAWTAPEVIGRSAVKAAAIIDHLDILHVAFVRTLDTPDSPAGIYYRSSEDLGVTWSLPVNLYASPYMRGLNTASAHITLASGTSATNQPTVYTAWDNRPLKQVFLAVSTDGGRHWGQPMEIDSPEAGIGSGRPFNIQVSVSGWNVLLVWQRGDSNTSCTQYYQWSPNQGDIWIDRNALDTGLSACAADNRLESIGENKTLLITAGQTQLNMMVWEGIHWSDPQAQRGMMIFPNPATLDSVELGCLQIAYHSMEDLLYIVGCDTSGGGDVWLRSRSVGDIPAWFPPPPIWIPPAEAFSREQPYLSPTLTYGPDEGMHVLWSQKDASGSVGSEAYRIYYSRYESQRWTRPVAVINSPGGHAGPGSAALTGDSRLATAWSDNANGKLYFSWASTAQAMMPSEWSEPRELPAPMPAARSPYLLEAQGTIYIAYALPLNEERGVYLTTSNDMGHTWSEPNQVFDAASAGWSMVDQPRLAITADGSMHTLFTRYSLPGGSGPEALYYSRSEDRGLTWSKPERVAEKPVSWNKLVFHQAQGLHRLWQETSGGRTQVMHQYSPDFGLTWSRAALIGSAAQQTGLVDLALDSAGRLHLLQSVQDYSRRQSVQHWLWDGERWSSQESLLLSETGNLQLSTLNAAISPGGTLSLIFAHPILDIESGLSVHQMHFSFRNLELPIAPMAALPPIPSETAPTTAIFPTSTPDQLPGLTILPTSTHSQDNLPVVPPLNAASPPAQDSYFGLALSAGVVAVMVVMVLGVIMVRKRK